MDFRQPEPGDTIASTERLASEEKLYTFAIMRFDLQMDTGKLAAQTAHCASQSLIEFLCLHPDYLQVFKRLGKSGSRIALKAKNLGQIERAYAEAQAAGLPCALFEDSGHIIPGTVFDGSPIITGLGIGPCTKEQARPITKRFQCL